MQSFESRIKTFFQYDLSVLLFTGSKLGGMCLKVFLLSFALQGVILLSFPDIATSLQCFKCSGANKDPYDLGANCNQIQICTGAENSCMIRVYRYTESSKTQSYSLKCRFKEDCERLGVGCNKDNSTSAESLTTCTACCESDRCNSPTTFKVDPSPPTSGQPHVLPSYPHEFTLAAALVWLLDHTLTGFTLARM